MCDTLLHNAIVVNDGTSQLGYVAIRGQFIEATGTGHPAPELMASAHRAIDLDGALLMPGAIDDQVHFRDPGLTHKADIATESAAAVAGGVTSFMDMPNTKPATVTLDALRRKHERAAQVAHANYSFFLGATNDNLPELLAADYTGIPGVKLFLGSSTGNMLVDNETTLDAIFSQVPALIAIHSEDEATIRANTERVKAEAGIDAPVELHPLIRSREACLKSTAAAIGRARRLNTRLHLLHISTADELQFFTPGPVEGKRITAEVCVHHLWYADSDYTSLGTRIKMNPAVKTAADRQALRQALADGRIDIVATDHAPHLLSEKQGGALTATSGAPMVQFSLPAMLELADQGVFTREMVVDRMCHAPARLFGIDRRGFILPGYYADLTAVRPNTPYTVTDAMVLSRCGWTPLIGTTLHNRVEMTWVNGSLAYSHGSLSPIGAALPLAYIH